MTDDDELDQPEEQPKKRPKVDPSAEWGKQVFDSVGPLIQQNEQITKAMSDLAATALVGLKGYDKAVQSIQLELAKAWKPAIDFALTDQFQAQRRQILESLAPALEFFRTGFLPPNLTEIEDVDLEVIVEVVMEDGIALFGLPRAEIAEEILSAVDAEGRRAVLDARRAEITEDCRDVVRRFASPATAPFAPFALAALDALDDGHFDAAQALTASLIDTVIRSHLGADRGKYTPNRKTKTNEAYYELSIRRFLAYSPIWEAHQNYFPDRNDPIPTTFNRHASAHAVGSQQYSPTNAVQGAMVACAFLRCIDEESLAKEKQAS